MRPLQIYLDSSDLSSLSDDRVMQKNTQLRDVRDFLLAQLDKGSIEIRYSFVHITEIAQIDHGYRDNALQRAAVLNKLCDGRVLLACDYLLLAELRVALGLDSNTFPSYAHTNNDQWIPIIENDVFDVRRRAIEQMKEVLRSYSRQQRRRLEKILFSGKGLSRKGIRDLTKANAGLTPYFKEEFPLTDRFWKEDMLSLYLMGEITEQNLTEELKRGFGNPENFIGWIVGRHDKDLKIPGWLRRQGHAYSILVEDLRNRAQQLKDIGNTMGWSEDNTLNKVSKFLSTDEIKATILSRELEELEVEKPIEKQSHSSCANMSVPMLDSFLGAAQLHAIDNLNDRRRNLQVSDMGDIMHCMYIPYVDIFRADAYAATVFQPLGKKYQTRIVGNLKQLPDIVEGML